MTGSPSAKVTTSVWPTINIGCETSDSLLDNFLRTHIQIRSIPIAKEFPMASGIGKQVLATLGQLQELQESVERTTAFAADLYEYAKKDFEAAQAHQEAVIEAASFDTEAIQGRIRQLSKFLGVTDISPDDEKLQDLLTPYTPRLPGLHKSSSQLDEEDTQGLETIDDLDDGDEVGTTSPQVSKSRQSTRATIGGDTPENFHLIGATHYSQLPWCTVIVLTKKENKWVELHCPECKGNASPGTQGLMRGLMAMKGHLTFSHDYESMNMDDVIALCTKRVVPIKEVHDICRRMESGMPYVEKILAKTKTTEHTEARKTGKPIGLLKGRSNDYSTVLWKWGRDPANRLWAFGCVVKHPDGSWYVLECPVCNGNFTNNNSSRNGFLNGAKAFYDHLRQGHGMNFGGEGVAAFIERCQVRKLTEREFEQLKRGSDKAIKIEKKLIKRNVVPKTAAEKEEIAAARAQRDLTGHKSGSAKRKGPGEVTNTWDYGRGQRAVDSSYGDFCDDCDDEEDFAKYAPCPKKAKTAKKREVITVSDDDEDDKDEVDAFAEHAVITKEQAFDLDVPFIEPDPNRRKSANKTKGRRVEPIQQDEDGDDEPRISSPYFKKTASTQNKVLPQHLGRRFLLSRRLLVDPWLQRPSSSGVPTMAQRALISASKFFETGGPTLLMAPMSNNATQAPL